MRVGRWSIAFVTASLAAAAPAIANAEEWRADGSRDLKTRYGEYLLLGGGVTDFTGDSEKDRFDTGGTWDVRLGIGSRYYVGAELAYVGSFRRGIGAGPDLLGNGAEGVVRLQYPYANGRWLIEPFAFGGIGWSRLSLRDAAPGVKDSDDIGVVPFGAGVTVGYGRVLFDARFTYRTSFDEDLPVAVNAGPASQEQWAAGASVGYEF